MEHLPTWTVLLVVIPVALVLVARRHDRSSPLLEAVAVGASAVAVAAAAMWFPDQVLTAVLIAIPMTLFFVGVLLVGAVVERIPSLVRRGTSSRPGHERRPAHRDGRTAVARPQQT